MTDTKYSPVIGAEIHIELKTKSKMFCGCVNNPFGADKPNIYTCPVCLGLPGALPVPNKKAIEDCLLIGLALNCKIANVSKFDRKHYFYPDLPKGYQISQYDEPFCQNGYLETSQGRVGITRVHMEEDTAKLLHSTLDGKKVTLVDFNRSGVPLVEIVTEPDIKNAEQAKELLKKIRDIVRALGVSDCDMEKGSMRLECNISLTESSSLPPYKVEVKNINSFRYFANSITYEIARQTEILRAGKLPIQETRGYRADTNSTVSQRTKEEAADYRYFPEPDIPPLLFSQAYIESIRARLPLLPSDRISSLVTQGVSQKSAELIAKNESLANLLSEIGAIDASLIAHAANLLVNKKISSRESASTIVDTIRRSNSSRISDPSVLEPIVDKVIKDNKQVVFEYQSGKLGVLGYLMSFVMKETSGQADAKIASELLKKKLK